jgi:hypothetical protein
LRFIVVAPAETGLINATGNKPHYYSLSRKAAKFGYIPKYSSLDGVFAEMAAILEMNLFASTMKVLNDN